MNKIVKSFTMTAGLAAFFAGGIAVAAILGTSGASAGGVSTPGDQVQEAASTLAVLSTAVTSADAIPQNSWKAAAEFGESGLDLASTRLIGQDAAGKYWAGEDLSGNVCLVIDLPKGGLSTGCTSVENFLGHGIALSYDERGEYAEAYLLPDGADIAIPASLTERSTNLLVGDTREVPASERSTTGSRLSAGDAAAAAAATTFSLYLLNPVGEPKEK